MVLQFYTIVLFAISKLISLTSELFCDAMMEP